MSEHISTEMSSSVPIMESLAKAFEEDDMELFGELLKVHLDSHNITVTEFADTIGLSRPTVYRVFSTDKDIRKDTIDKVLSGVGLKLAVVTK